MLRPYNILPILICCSWSLQSQSTLDQLLASVEANNQSIHAERQRIEADIATFRTGLSLPDPTLMIDWMKGFPSSAGNQTELIAAQTFDFPSAYKFRRQISALQEAGIQYQGEHVRREVLRETRLLAIQAIYLNKRKAELTRRLLSVERFLDNYTTKLEQQDATIIEVRRARLRLINTRTDLGLLETMISDVNQQLTRLNGGLPVTFIDTTYPVIPVFAGFDSLYAEIQDSDPGLQHLEIQKQMAGAQILLTRAELLPKFEAGYRYQGILNQNFHGIHTGIQLPLWENRKRIHAGTLQAQVCDARIAERQTQLYHETRQLFNQYSALKAHSDDYRRTLMLVSDTTLLDKALRAGQITVLEYFLETSIYDESVDRSLALEESLHRALTNLLQYRL